MKRSMKRLLGFGALAAVVYGAWRAYERRRVESGVTWDPQPFPFPPTPHVDTTPEPAPAPTLETTEPETTEPETTEPETTEPETTEPVGATSWVEPAGAVCPASHPVKVKLSSGIFHVPGGMNYERTRADRCYASTEAAEADGFRPAKR